MVWEEAVNAMLGLMEKWGNDKRCIAIKHIPEVTVQVGSLDHLTVNLVD